MKIRGTKKLPFFGPPCMFTYLLTICRAALSYSSLLRFTVLLQYSVT